MTLWPPFSGSKPQRGEDRVGGGRLGLPRDPLLDPREAFGRLMDVVAVGDIGKGFEQLFEAFGAPEGRRRLGHPASRRAHNRSRASVSSHPSAFPCGSARIHRAFAA
jgi:hypothetical protein